MLKRPILYVIQGLLTVCVSGDNMWMAKLTIDLRRKLNRVSPRRVFSDSCKQSAKHVFIFIYLFCFSFGRVGVGGGGQNIQIL